MNETPKTLTFLAAAAVVLLLAVVTRPSLPTAKHSDVRGQLLYPDFKDPLAVASLEIVEFDETNATLHPFKVASIEHKGKTRWVIPSHDNYPADAKEQVASAATALMRMKILNMATDAQGDQAEYGVVEPDRKTLKVGMTGVGLKIVMKDKQGNELLALVIGKEAGKPGLRYVRKVGQDAVYVVEARTDKFSTKFENWIERNLLQVSSFDVNRLWIHDYAVKETEMGPTIQQRARIELAHNDSGEPKWKLLDDQRLVADPKNPRADKWTSVKMAPDEELNAAKLGDLMYALDDLKIVDVSLKPAGLSADLKAGRDLLSRREALKALRGVGFLPGQLEENGPVEIYSSEGEIRVGAASGVEYVLRFGDIAGRGSAKKADKKPNGKDGDKKATDSSPGLNRYLFIMAEFNAALLAKPQFELLPEAKKAAAEKKAADSKKANESKKPADAKKPADKDKKAEPKKPVENSAKELEAEKKALDAERERIGKENKRKLEEYEQKVADGKKRVSELNARFADWYYVISDDVFHKIHLGRDQIVKKKDKPKEQGKASNGDHVGHDHQPPAEGLDKFKAEGPAEK
ncbi:MAG: DUF4340 domain-containing protein [Thermoguttaceae bacterium]